MALAGPLQGLPEFPHCCAGITQQQVALTPGTMHLDDIAGAALSLRKILPERGVIPVIPRDTFIEPSGPLRAVGFHVGIRQGSREGQVPGVALKVLFQQCNGVAGVAGVAQGSPESSRIDDVALITGKERLKVGDGITGPARLKQGVGQPVTGSGLCLAF